MDTAIKWKIVNHTSFTGTAFIYNFVVKLTGLGWYWAILQDGTIVDEAYNHSPTNSELAAKVQCQRVFDARMAKTITF